MWRKNKERCIKKVHGIDIMKKTRKGYKKWLLIDSEDYVNKKKIKENTEEIDTRQQKQMECKKNNQICGMSLEELQQRIEQVIQKMKELLKRLKC